MNARWLLLGLLSAGCMVGVVEDERPDAVAGGAAGGAVSGGSSGGTAGGGSASAGGAVSGGSVGGSGAGGGTASAGGETGGGAASAAIATQPATRSADGGWVFRWTRHPGAETHRVEILQGLTAVATFDAGTADSLVLAADALPAGEALAWRVLALRDGETLATSAPRTLER